MYKVIQISEIKSILKTVMFFVFIVISVSMNAQTDKKYIRKGNREYEKDKYPESEISYRKAIDKNKQSPDALFNIGDALYKQNKFQEAGNQFIENANQNNDKVRKSNGFYNLGNSLLKANKLQESIEAYKNSLILRPDNNEAKYNLAYAQDLLKKQQEQQKQQEKNKQNKDKNSKNNDKNKPDQNKDQQKDQQNDQNKDKEDQKQQQQNKQEISKDDAQRLLNSIANDEKNVQEKVKLAKATKAKVRSVKNW
jgi:Ca-activated chloride channel homolog